MEKLKKGDMVKILQISNSIPSGEYQIGDICEVYRVFDDRVWVYVKKPNNINHWWCFILHEVELIKGVKPTTESCSKQISQSLKQICTKGLVIKSEDIIAKVKESISTEYVFGDTILRALRHLRQDGILDYTANKNTREYTFK